MLCIANAAEKSAPRHQADQRSYSTRPWHLRPATLLPVTERCCDVPPAEIRINLSVFAGNGVATTTEAGKHQLAPVANSETRGRESTNLP